MTEEQLQKCSTSLVIREMQIKTTLRFSHYSEQRRSKFQVPADAGEDVEKEQHSSTAGGIASLNNHSGNQYGGSLENWTQYYQRIPQYLSWAYTQKIPQLVEGHMLHYVHSSLIYNSQKLDRTQMSLKRGMDTEIILHLHNGVLLSY